MDELFKINTDTAFTERHGSLVTKFRTENEENKGFFKRTEELRANILQIAPSDLQKAISDYLLMLDSYKEAEGRYLYAQGILDCIRLYRLLDSDFSSIAYDEYLSNGEIPSVKEYERESAMYEHAKDSQLTRFTKTEWYGYAGSTRFANGSDPFIGHNLMLEIVADKMGLCVMPYYDDNSAISGGWALNIETEHDTEHMVEMLARRILKDTKAMFPAEIDQYLKDKGFTDPSKA